MTGPTNLAALGFMDVYIRLDQEGQGRFRPLGNQPGMPRNKPIPSEMAASVESLRVAVKELASRRKEFTLTHENVRLRASVGKTACGEVWCALRRIPLDIPPLAALNIDAKYRALLQSMVYETGLIMVIGATGHGKTTTTTSLLAEFLNSAQGDVAVTIEDPCEYDFQRPWGNGGFCWQFDVESEHDWAEHLKAALRWHPRYIYVGEVRSPEGAAQLLRAANSGHLCLTTIHGGSIEEGIESLIQIAAAEIGEQRAQGMLATGLVAAVHQQMALNNRPNLKILMAERGARGDAARNLIRERKVEHLGLLIDQQQRVIQRPNFPIQAPVNFFQLAKVATA